MNGLSLVAGVGPRVTINGKSFEIRGKTNAYYADMEAAIRKSRGNPLDLVVEAAKRAVLENDPAILSTVATAVSERFRSWNTATYGDYLDYMNTPDGDALTVFHALKDGAPDVTLEQVKLWLVQTRFHGGDAGRAKVKEVFDAIATASGEDQLGNSSGQPGQETPPSPAASTGS